jgi:hypothetical protein
VLFQEVIQRAFHLLHADIVHSIVTRNPLKEKGKGSEGREGGRRERDLKKEKREREYVREGGKSCGTEQRAHVRVTMLHGLGFLRETTASMPTRVRAREKIRREK